MKVYNFFRFELVYQFWKLKYYIHLLGKQIMVPNFLMFFKVFSCSVLAESKPGPSVDSQVQSLNFKQHNYDLTAEQMKESKHFFAKEWHHPPLTIARGWRVKNWDTAWHGPLHAKLVNSWDQNINFTKKMNLKLHFH